MGRRKRANLTDLLNNLTYKNIFNRYKNLALNVFQWDGLPPNIKEEYIEKILFEHGKAIFFEDKNLGLLCLQAQDGVGINVYGYPTSYVAIGMNYTERYDDDDCVIICNNKLRTPTINDIMMFVNKVCEAERTMDVNIKSVKSPVVFACDDKDVLTFKQIFAKVDGNEPAIFADKNLNLNAIEVYDMKAQFMCNDIMDYKHSVENELLTLLGINNVSVDKKERLISDEANANNELIQQYVEIMLEARQRACEEINAKYDLNVSVKLRNTPQIEEGNDDELE